MVNEYIKALAEVLDINTDDYRHLSQSELLAMLEDQQALEVATI